MPQVQERRRIGENEFQRVCDDYVHQHVLCCVSPMISDLFNSIGLGLPPGVNEVALMCLDDKEDWVEAAEQNGAVIVKTDDGAWVLFDGDVEVGSFDNAEEAAQHYCYDHDLDPYRWEAYEHWLVDEHFAYKLEQAGEVVVRNFWSTMTIWGRTCTGQAIAMDGEVRRIVSEVEGVQP